MTTSFTQFHPNRRALLKGIPGLFLIAPVASSIARAQEPKRGGVLKIAVSGSTTDSLDPAALVGSMEILLALGQLRNCLVEIDENSRAVPELAEAWESSSDLKRWTFKIRSGVEFHDGKKLSTDDVIYSIKYHMGEQSKSAAKSLLGSVTSIEADGSGSVVFSLSEANADFPYLLSDYHLQIVPAGTQGADFFKGIGTGGYILESFQPGERAIVRRNPNYWKSDRAHFDRIETYSINDNAAKTSSLVTSEVDLVANPEMNTLDLLQKASGVAIAATYGRAHPTLAMRVTDAPFDDKELRLALKYAIDREDIVRKVLKGYGEIGNDQPISSAYPYFNANLTKHVYDPDKARAHVKRSKTPDAVIDLHAANSAFAGAIDMALLFREHAAKAGININVIRAPEDGYWDNVWMKVPFCVSNWFGRPTEDMMFSLTYGKTASWNETVWTNERFEKLLVEARATGDDAVRKSAYAEMQEIVAEDGGTIVPFFNADIVAHRDTIAHGKIGSNAPLDGFRLPERWWHL